MASLGKHALFVLNAGIFEGPGQCSRPSLEVEMTIQNQNFDIETRPEFYRMHNGEKAMLPFSAAEYETRLTGLRVAMAAQGVDTAVLTSMHNVAYYSGFLYCAFGRPYAIVVTANEAVTISAGIDAGQPWRRCHGDNITYTD